MGRLNDVFEEKLVQPRDLAVHRALSISDLGSGSGDIGQAAISASTETMRTSLRVDYSSYSNFVFFNSALDYFNITGEKILNEYPFSGTLTEHLMFLSGCDDYQRWLVESSWLATLGQNSGSHGYIKDPESKMVPGTGSFSVELLFGGATPTGTIIERASGSRTAYSIWLSSSAGVPSFYFYVSGATGATTCSYSLNVSEANVIDVRYLSFVCDNDADQLRIIHAPDLKTLEDNRFVSGFLAMYPDEITVVASASIVGIGAISSPSGTWVTVGSGSKGLGDVKLTDLSYWSKARSVGDLATSYAGNIYAQDGLVALYRFNEVNPENGGTYLVRNSAGSSIDLHVDRAPIIALFSGTTSLSQVNSSSLLTISHTPEPVVSFGQTGDLSGVIESYVSGAQQAAWLYDKDNTNIITRMVPEAYLQLEQEMGTEVLQDFLYIVARQFDQVKVAIDQFVYWNKANYTGYNDTPDALLKDAANYYGWDFVGSFLNHDAIKYFFGKGIVPGIDLETKLYQIKNEFWRRTLNELSHIYKTKGTRESVEALIRVYGMDQKIVKLKEYGVKQFGQITTTRINSHRSVPAYCVRSGTNDRVVSVPISGVDGFTLSLHSKFIPFLTTSVNLSGTIFSLGKYELRYSGSAGSQTASLALFSGSTALAAGQVPIADGRWWNIFATVASSGSSSWKPAVMAQRLDEDTVADRYSYSGSFLSSTLSGTTFSATLGHERWTDGQFYTNEVKLYRNYPLGSTERDAQTLDFQSYGVLDIDDMTGSLRMHWRLDDAYVVPSGVNPNNYKVYDFSGYGVSGTLSATIMSSTYRPFKRFMFDYNFIAPVEYGWNEDKIRVYPSSTIPWDDHFNEANALALEFNLVDALNEDISKILATMDNWNNVLGVPANRFRDSYPDLDRYRNYYFNKLHGRINFREFADILEFFDKSFVKMVQRLLPARAIFYGEEFVVESHMLERPKVQWAYRRYNPELVPEGIITMVDRSGSDNAAVTTTLFYA